MSILNLTELAVLRRKTALGVVPVTWDKNTINTALQAVEDELETQLFDAPALIEETIRVNAEAVDVKTRLDAGEVSPALTPVVDDWLLDHPPSVTTRTVDDGGITSKVTADRTLFDAAVSGMPSDQRAKLIELVMRRRVEAAV